MSGGPQVAAIYLTVLLKALVYGAGGSLLLAQPLISVAFQELRRGTACCMLRLRGDTTFSVNSLLCMIPYVSEIHLIVL